MDKKLLNLLTIKNIEGIGNKRAKDILSNIDLNKEIYLEELFEMLKKYNKIKIKSFNEIKNAYKKALDTIKKMKSLDIGHVCYFDDIYPESLKKIDEPPVILYYKGNINLLSQSCVAIIGTRTPSALGKKIAYDLSAKLCKEKVIVSGLAEGIDTQAHLAAVGNGGKTIAILAHGLDMVYPKCNEGLFKEIIEREGLVLSEYPPGYKYRDYTFVSRDRLQSALSDEVYIIEAGEKSGSLHAAKKALEYKKKLYVFCSVEKNFVLPKGNKILLEEGAIPFNENYFF